MARGRASRIFLPTRMTEAGIAGAARQRWSERVRAAFEADPEGLLARLLADAAA